jgi:hypothetical protein
VAHVGQEEILSHHTSIAAAEAAAEAADIAGVSIVRAAGEATGTIYISMSE